MTKHGVALGLAVLLLTAGCMGGGAGPSEEALSRNATYDWNTSAEVTVTLTGDEYRAVASVDNESSVALATSGGFGGRSPLYISAVKFRYPNGTVVGADAVEVYTSGSRTVVEFPAANGTFAYTAGAGPRSVTIPVGFDGSHEVVLPPGMRVWFPVFGVVEPGGYEKTVVDDRVHLYWESLDGGTITVKYYLQRDLYIFGGIVGLLALAGAAGVVYFRKRIRRLEREREDAGLDVERER